MRASDYQRRRLIGPKSVLVVVIGDVSGMWIPRDGRCRVMTSEKENRFSATRWKRERETL